MTEPNDKPKPTKMKIMPRTPKLPFRLAKAQVMDQYHDTFKNLAKR